MDETEWLTAVVARVCLNMLRARKVRREDSLDAHVPDPIISPDGELQPEDEALLADSVDLALLVVLDTLTPAERLAFVLHDMFELPFEEIDTMVGRSPRGGRRAGTLGITLTCPRQPFAAYLSAPENSTDVTASSPTTQASWPG